MTMNHFIFSFLNVNTVLIGMGDLARGQGEMPTGGAGGKEGDGDVDRGDYSESNYDEFTGYSGALFAGSTYDDDDAEADKIYDMVSMYFNMSTIVIILIEIYICTVLMSYYIVTFLNYFEGGRIYGWST